MRRTSYTARKRNQYSPPVLCLVLCLLEATSASTLWCTRKDAAAHTTRLSHRPTVAIKHSIRRLHGHQSASAFRAVHCTSWAAAGIRSGSSPPVLYLPDTRNPAASTLCRLLDLCTDTTQPQSAESWAAGIRTGTSPPVLCLPDAPQLMPLGAHSHGNGCALPHRRRPGPVRGQSSPPRPQPPPGYSVYRRPRMAEEGVPANAELV